MWFLFTPLALADPREVLSAADGVSCVALGTADDTLYAELIALAAPEVTPSFLPMRAAQCLLELYPERPDLGDRAVAWTADPATSGLALLVASRIDRLPLDVALRVQDAARALPEGRPRQRILRAIARSARPELTAD